MRTHLQAELDRERTELARARAAHEDAMAKLRQEMALALQHVEEEALALRTQLEKRLDAANKQLAAALAEAAGLKQELAALKLEYSKYKARAEARDAEQLAFVLNSLDSTLLYTCIVRSHNKSARAV
jgi:septal ring factor EnvC (AmiA/AmiB activator)